MNSSTHQLWHLILRVVVFMNSSSHQLWYLVLVVFVNSSTHQLWYLILVLFMNSSTHQLWYLILVVFMNSSTHQILSHQVPILVRTFRISCARHCSSGDASLLVRSWPEFSVATPTFLLPGFENRRWSGSIPLQTCPQPALPRMVLHLVHNRQLGHFQ